MSNSNDSAYILLKFIGEIILLVIATLYDAFVLIKLWSWFVIALFPTFPHLNYPIAVGLGCVSFMLTNHSLPDNKGMSIHGWYMKFMLPTISLGVGWIAYLFI